jgi:hypothetical protein
MITLLGAWLGRLLWPAIAAGLCSITAFLYGVNLGYARGTAERAAALAKAQAQANAATARRIVRGTVTGERREQDRAAIERVFTTLATEADHEAPDPVDACELPAARLRRWAAANAGAADAGAPAGQPDGGAAAPAAPGVGPDEGPGSQPPGGGAGLPPAGQPALPAAGVDGDQP